MGFLNKLKESTGSSLKRIEGSTDIGLKKIGFKEDDSPREPVKALVPFTKKFEDHSIATGYQFTFFCDVSGEGYKSGFYESRTKTRSNKLQIIGKGVNIGSSITSRFVPIPLLGTAGKNGANENKVEELMESLANKYGEMSAAWHKEHQEAFDLAQTEAKQFFKQCSVCKRWACDYCWNAERGMCKDDATKFLTCTQCNQLTSTGKFCKNCGALVQRECPKCNSVFEPGTKFCVECGSQLTN